MNADLSSRFYIHVVEMKNLSLQFDLSLIIRKEFDLKCIKASISWVKIGSAIVLRDHGVDLFCLVQWGIFVCFQCNWTVTIIVMIVDKEGLFELH